MNRSILRGKVFSVDSDTDHIVAAVQSDGTVRHYDCTLRCCDNPVCTCKSVHLKFSPQENSGQDNPATPYLVDMDVVEGKLVYEDESKVPPENLAFARLLLSSLDEADFQFLMESHFLYKNEITEKADIEMIEADFDFQDIEENAALHAYHDVLPYADQLNVSFGDGAYLIYDHYCLKPKCSCADTVIEFIPSKQSNQSVPEQFSIEVNYKTKRWAPVEGHMLPVEVGAVKSAVKDQIPNIYKLLLKRHIKLKKIYTNCKRKHFRQKLPKEMDQGQEPGPHKVGRNDLCPCGSGKKYKKCCM